MAYAQENLSPAGAQSKAGKSPGMWTYKGTEAKSAIAASGYFNSASSVLNIGDLIFYYKTDSTVSASLHVVLTNASGVVDVSAGTDVSVA